MHIRCVSSAAVLLLLAALPVRAADTAYSIKVLENTHPPKEVPEAIQKLLGVRCVQLLDNKGEVLAEVWVRKEVPAKATEAQVKNGLTLREVPESSLLGLIRVAKQLTDYRKQKVPPGIYTLRLALQPQDGDHMGTAPYSDFVLASPIADDKGQEKIPAKALFEMSAKTTGGHAAVFLLFPGKEAVAQPKLADKGEGQWVILFKLDVTAAGQKTTLGIGLTLIGASPSA